MRGTTMGESVPRSYRSLLATYPKAWRDEHAAVVLGTLLSVHSDGGRTRPSVGDRLRFGVDGLRVRFVLRFQGRPARRFVDVAALQGFRTFDQDNGSTPRLREVSELEQLRANSAVDRNDDEARVAALAWVGLTVQG